MWSLADSIKLNENSKELKVFNRSKMINYTEMKYGETFYVEEIII